MTPRCLSLVMLILVLGSVQAADAAVLCVNGGGAVSVRPISCLPAEMPLDPADLGVGGTPTDGFTIVRRSVALGSSPASVAEVQVPSGHFVVSAYAFINNDGAGPFNAPIICTMASGGAFDLAALVLQPFTGGTNISGGTISFNSAASLPSGGAVSLDCYNNNGSPWA